MGCAVDQISGTFFFDNFLCGLAEGQNYGINSSPYATWVAFTGALGCPLQTRSLVLSGLAWWAHPGSVSYDVHGMLTFTVSGFELLPVGESWQYIFHPEIRIQFFWPG